MKSSILRDIKNGNLILFLGAGASYGCKTSAGLEIPGSESLAKIFAEAAGFEYGDEPLDVVYEACRSNLGVRLNSLLEENFRHVRRSSQYDILAQYVWRRIYSLNIDDGLDSALLRHSPQKIDKRNSRDPVIDRAPFFDTLQYIKLNGCADRLQDGIIFSPSEYAQASASHLPWYSQCASDFIRAPILFIGTTLNEPLLKFHIERYQSLNDETPGVSYLISRSATPIQIASLKRYNIEFIPGTMEDFTRWLEAELPQRPSISDIAIESIPQLKAFKSAIDKPKFADLFEHVTAVKRDLIAGESAVGSDTIRDFYKGFKPTWQDIAQAIPAELDVQKVIVEKVERTPSDSDLKLIPILGPSGSGKTTVLMQTCWHFSTREDWAVFFIDAVPASLLETLLAIEASSASARVLVAIDNLEFVTENIQHALDSGKVKKTILIGSERESAWNRRAKAQLKGKYQEPIYIREFTRADASRILRKVEAYGSWTRLGKMSESDRLKELVGRSKKQLLIALLEATLGRGFGKIIEEEYSRIADADERVFLVAVSITTDRRCVVPISLIDRALDKMSILRGAGLFVESLAGVIYQTGETLSARHPVYAKYLLDKVVDPTIAAKAVNGLLQAFSDYKSPVIQNIPRSESVLYKALINHKFLYELLQGNKTRVLQTYRGLEKKFERDGLFWLQYGLALRDFEEHSDALEKLRIASAAYPMPHTKHALAQQLMHGALLESSSALAMGMAEEAKGILEGLDYMIDSDDTYPIVTLSVGYTNVLRRHSNEEHAQRMAKDFALALQIRTNENPGRYHLREAYERIFKYASTGSWQSSNDGFWARA